MKPDQLKTLEENGAAWIYFQILTFVRIQRDQARSANTPLSLESLSDIDDAIIKLLQDPSKMKLPEGVTLEETTPVEEIIDIMSIGGQVSESCDKNGCSCSDGYIRTKDGRHSIKPILV